MLDFAVKVAERSHVIDDADYEKLKSHGFSDDDAWDIAAIAAMFAMSNRLANAFSIRANDEFYAMGRESRDLSDEFYVIGRRLRAKAGTAGRVSKRVYRHEGGMNATGISRSCVPCRRGAGGCGRGRAHRRGRIWRLAHRRAGRAPPDHAGRPAGAFCDEVDSEHVAARQRALAPKFQRRRRASRSIFSPPGSTCRASFASRRTAISSWRRPERARCVSFARAELAPVPRKARSSHKACSGLMGLRSTLRAKIRVLSMSRRRTLSCAFPIAAER